MSPRRSSLAVLVLVGLAGCQTADPDPASTPGPLEYPVTSGAIVAGAVASCSGTAGAWQGCRGNGCLVCSETTASYPYYFVNHPLCDRNLTCGGTFSTCNANCPAPSNADKEPIAGKCDGTSGQWAGCRGNGCAVCSEKLTAYPYYFLNHRNCVRNDSCANQFSTCNANCPAPTDADKAPPAGTCSGTTGQWAGCRGNGCAVCAEKLSAFPNYLKNHPNCVLNSTCAGVFGTCNSNCPAPGDADRAVVPTQCDATPGQWAGCRGSGCAACGEVTQAYPYYFANHPLCSRNLTCGGQFYTCNANCPAPSSADNAPAAGTCDGSAGQWAACRGNGCAVCSEMVKDHPFYFHHHPKCVRNDICGGQFFTCNDGCPAPTDLEKQPPAGTCGGTAGQWAGCRGNGCMVCSEKLAGYPNYIKNHPNCVLNTTCAGVFGTCNSNCPAPTDADKGTGTAVNPFANTSPWFCPNDGELVVSADNTWQVYSDGTRLKPIDSSNVETDWRKPAKYKIAFSGGKHVLAIHAADAGGGLSGLIANLKVRGMEFGGSLTDGPTNWQVLPAGQTPPSNWTTAATLAWQKPAVASDACRTVWAADGTFSANWKAAAGVSPLAWLWTRACDSSQAGWQRDNWYRLVVDIHCNSGSTTCPDGTACPIQDSAGVVQDIGICKNGLCGKATCDDLPAQMDANGGIVLPTKLGGLADMSTMVSESVDEDTGAVTSTTDTADSVGDCAPVIGADPPAEIQGGLTSKAQEVGNVPLSDLGVGSTGNQLAAAMKPLSDPSSPEHAKLAQIAQVLAPAWSKIAGTSAAAPTYAEPPVCDGARNPADPFGGRDIIFVHGYDPDVIFAKHLEHSTEAMRTWGSNPEDFYSGYYKHKAEAYWQQHIARYLTGHKNRYLVAAWSTNERMDVAVDAVLTQMNDAIREGRGVVAAADDPRRRTGFCVPDCVVVTHSTGAPVTDVAMAIANETPSLKFIPDHVKAQVAFEGAFGGSPAATIAIEISKSLNGGGTGIAVRDLCTLFLRLISPGASCPETMPDFSDTVNVDLVPWVTEALWQPTMGRTPVPTLTVNGGHASAPFPVIKMLFPGFDDGTLTSNSTCANPTSSLLGPSAFWTGNTASLFDLGMINLSWNPWKDILSAVRPLGYWLDQAIDPLIWTRPGLGNAAASCTPYLSPWGMVQPVDLDPGLSLQRMKNHYSFIQTAASHSIADLNSFDGGKHNYEPVLGGARSFEETRVITDDSVYNTRGGRDPAPLVSSAMQTMQRSRNKGWRITLGFGSFKKRFWIWRRRYHQLDQMDTKDQGDYVYQNVVTSAPAPTSTSNSCVSGNITVRASGVSSPLGTVRIGYVYSAGSPPGPGPGQTPGGFVSCDRSGNWDDMQTGCGVVAGSATTTARVTCDAASYAGTHTIDRIELKYRDRPNQTISCTGEKACEMDVPFGGGVDATCVFTSDLNF